jgi:pyruvate dehydrogenase E1 component beta subunit
MSSVEVTEAAGAAGDSQRKRRLTIARALNEALQLEMAVDPSVLVMGEDIATIGGVWGTTQGLLQTFGPQRVRDTPISEAAFIGAAVGMAASGCRPVVELMFVDFFGVCMNSIYSLAAKQRFFSGGQVKCPLVLMTAVGGGYSDAGQHSQCLYATFGHLPGMHVVLPSNAYDAKGMLISAIRDDNPVVFMFHKGLQGVGWLGTLPTSVTHVPSESYQVPLDEAAVVRAGSDLTLVGLGPTVHHAMSAAAELQKEGVSAEVIDLRSIAPLDRKTICNSVRKTGRLLAVDDDYLSYGISSEVVASAATDVSIQWKSAPQRISYPDVPVPFSPVLEQAFLPNPHKVLEAARNLMSGKSQ